MANTGDDQDKARDRSGQTRYPAGFADALGRTIKVLRADMGLSRKELAEAAKISYSGLTAIENGNNPPSSSLLVPIATALGVRPSYLLELAEQRMEGQSRGQSQALSQALSRSRAEGPDEYAVLAPPSSAPTSPEQGWAERFASPERRDRQALYSEARRDLQTRQRLRTSAEGSAEGPDLDRRHPAEIAAARELEHLLERMAPDDIERLLDYARRLAR